ncbi:MULTISPECIES: HK97-gp10 family putative phage morphogenesis protein [unclassified Sphingobium]|uniref:HK97-gp10 family putative phage morphogenesis protein n=1 Tax=unclassified Sphingobium TaxID=2611147 RepID=UPI0035A6C4CA
MKFTCTGFGDIERALADLKQTTGKSVLRRVGRKALEPVKNKAWQLAPVDTGGLADSITISGTQKGGIHEGKIPGIPNNPKSQVRLFVGPDTRFSHRGELQEWGTFSNPPQPFMRPAWESEKMGVLSTITKELKGEIERTAARAAKRGKGK